MRRLILPMLLALAAVAGCGGDDGPDRVAVTIYASGPPGAERPAVDAVQRVIAARGGVSGRYRITFSWTGVPRDAPASAALAAARRAVEDPRAVAYVDAGTGTVPVQVVQLLNLAGVPTANVAEPRLARALCGRDPFPSGVRTAVAPRGGGPAQRATAVTETVLDALAPLPAEFDRRPVTRALLARFGAC